MFRCRFGPQRIAFRRARRSAAAWRVSGFLAKQKRARRGARAGSLEPTDDAAAVDEADRATATYLGVAGLDASDATMATTLPGDAVRVVVTYPAGSLTGLTSVVVPSRVQASAQMRRR